MLANGLGPKESNDKASANCLPMEQQPIVNLEAPIEDCDFPMGTAEDEITICKFFYTKNIVPFFNDSNFLF